MKTAAALLAAVAIAALTLLPSTSALATGHRIQINEIYYNSPGRDTGSNSRPNATGTGTGTSGTTAAPPRRCATPATGRWTLATTPARPPGTCPADPHS